MPNWRARLKLKDLLSHEDVGPETARALGQEAATRLTRSPFSAPERSTLIDLFEDVHDQDDFNNALAYLYDVADAQRIWIT